MSKLSSYYRSINIYVTALNEFKPSLFFLLRFLGVYFVGNVLYGIYIESFGDKPDPVTHYVTNQTASFLSILGLDVNARDNTQGPTVFLETANEIVLGVYEGCNGLNVMIVFVGFLIAFGGPWKKCCGSYRQDFWSFTFSTSEE